MDGNPRTNGKRGPRRRALYGLLVVLFLLHQDFWWWDDARRVVTLPIGLAYHLAYCFAVAAVMALLVRYGWPQKLDDEANAGREDAT